MYSQWISSRNYSSSWVAASLVSPALAAAPLILALLA